MVSEVAVEELEKMRRDGLVPSVRDIIRLNALGLRIEAARNRRSTSSIYYLPRVAAISPTVSFRQPTIGHDVWMDSVERIVDDADFETVVAVKAYALSRPACELPDPDDPKSVKLAIDTFCDEMRDFTRDQICAAIRYALYGADPNACECAETKKVGEEADTVDDQFGSDWNFCVAAGVMREGMTYLHGFSVGEMERMTTDQVRDAVRRSYKLYGIEEVDVVNDAVEDFYVTADAIRGRLEKERGNRNV